MPVRYKTWVKNKGKERPYLANHRQGEAKKKTQVENNVQNKGRNKWKNKRRNKKQNKWNKKWQNKGQGAEGQGKVKRTKQWAMNTQERQGILKWVSFNKGGISRQRTRNKGKISATEEIVTNNRKQQSTKKHPKRDRKGKKGSTKECIRNRRSLKGANKRKKCRIHGRKSRSKRQKEKKRQTKCRSRRKTKRWKICRRQEKKSGKGGSRKGRGVDPVVSMTVKLVRIFSEILTV